MSETFAADWDPREEVVLQDQRLAYDAMRERCPVARSDFLSWSLFRHEDVVGVLADPATYSNASRHPALPNGMDPPEHTRYRRALEPFFASERMAAFEPRCRRIAVDLLRPLLAQGDVDIVDAFAEPFPLQALCAFLGWPLESWERFRGWNHDNAEATFAQDREAGKTLALTLAEYVGAALQAHRNGHAEPGEDATAALTTMESDGEGLTDEDIVGALRNWTAGEGTVASAIELAVAYLSEHPDIQQRLRDDPALIPVALDEILRLDGPLVANRRTTTRDVTIDGREIPAGETISLMWIAANRDDRAFDDADELRLDRDQGGNLLFGAGIHNCMGAPMARLQMRIAVEELLAGTSRIELVNTEPLRRATYPGNGFHSLRIRLS